MTDAQIGEMLFHWCLWINGIALLICWFLYPFNRAWNSYTYNLKCRYNYTESLRWWHYLNYGGILKGFIFGLIPVINICVIIDCLCDLIGDLIDRLSKVKVFKEKEKDESY